MTIGRAVVYYAQAAQAFSAGIEGRHCKCESFCSLLRVKYTFHSGPTTKHRIYSGILPPNLALSVHVIEICSPSTDVLIPRKKNTPGSQVKEM